MPIKTEFLGLDKLQTNEYYSSDTENTNLDKIDDKLKDHEERTVAIEDVVHKKNQLQANLTESKKTMSVIDSFSGACGVEIEGRLSENLIKNPFYIDCNSWETYSGTSVMSGNNLIATGNGTDRALIVAQNIGKWSVGKKVFVRARIRTLDSSASAIIIAIRKKADTFSALGHVQIDNPIPGKWYEGVFDAIGEDESDMLFNLYCSWPDKDSQNGKRIELDGEEGSLLVELDESEHPLSLEELSKKYPNSFEGLQPLRNIALKSVGKNRFSIHGLRNKPCINSAYTGIKLENILEKGTQISYKVSLKKNLPENAYIGLVRGKSVNPNVDGGGVLWLVKNNNMTINGSTIATDDFKYISIFTESSASGYTMNRELLYNLNDYLDITIVEGDQIPSNHIKYLSTDILIGESLAKLPNGVFDKISNSNGKLIKNINTNLGRDNDFRIVKGSDIIGELQTTASNINYAYTDIGFLSDMKVPTSAVDRTSYMSGRKESIVDSHVWNSEYLTNIYSVSPDGRIYFSFPKSITTTSEAKAQLDKENIKFVYQLKNPNIKELDLVEPICSFDDYTQFNISDGFVKGEKINFHLEGTAYYANDYRYPSSWFNYKTRKIIDVYELKNGIKKSVWHIGGMGTVTPNGHEKWFISKDYVEKNDIDVERLYVDYITLESNGYSNAVISYNADMSTALSSNASVLNLIGEQVDKNTSEVVRLGEKIRWIEPTLLNGVESLPNLPIAYAKDVQGWVYLSGGSNGTGVLGEAHFRLPEGYRPKGTLSFVVHSNNSTRGVIQISSSGHVFQVSGATNACTYHQVSFFVGE